MYFRSDFSHQIIFCSAIQTWLDMNSHFLIWLKLVGYKLKLLLNWGWSGVLLHAGVSVFQYRSFDHLMLSWQLLEYFYMMENENSEYICIDYDTKVQDDFEPETNYSKITKAFSTWPRQLQNNCLWWNCKKRVISFKIVISHKSVIL